MLDKLEKAHDQLPQNAPGYKAKTLSSHHYTPPPAYFLEEYTPGSGDILEQDRVNVRKVAELTNMIR